MLFAFLLPIRAQIAANSAANLLRGLKQAPDAFAQDVVRVAPHAGAWIETNSGMSELMRCPASHPTRVRGLKPSSPRVRKASHSVAPHAGAWIETGWTRCRTCCACCRTPHGCVIEVGRLERSCKPACHDAPLRIHDLKLPAKTYPKAGLNKKALTEFSIRAFCFFLELVKGLEPITCRLQISCSTD